MTTTQNAPAAIDWKNEATAALLSNQAVLEDDARAIKAQLDGLRAELQRRVAANLDAAVEDAGKQHGAFSFIHDGLPLKAQIDKDVEWDSAKLMPVVGALPWETARKLFKIDFSIPEAIYKTLPATMSTTPELAELLKQIEAARTVKYGKPKITARAS